MVTALSLMRGAPSSAPLDQDTKVTSLARWLAHQRAVPIHLVESTALEIANQADRDPLDGPKAPFVVQPRGALWLIGKLGGRALLHIVPDQEAAIERGRELAEDDGVSLLTVGQGGEVTRWRPETLAKPLALAPARTLAPQIEVAADSPELPRAPQIEVAADSPELPLEVRRHPGGWAVMLRGRVIATAPTREKARLRKKALAADPDFVANPQPDTAL